MESAEFRLYLDDEQADEEQLDLFGEIRVDQSIGMATEAEITIPVDVDSTGLWSGMEEDFVQPFRRVRVEVKAGDGNFVPLIDGPIVGHLYELSPTPGESRMVLRVMDDSVLLNREEKVVLYEDLADHEIASRLLAEYDLTAEVEETAGPGASLTRAVVQRGTNMQLLRELARRHGMFAYVRPGDEPGKSVGVLERPDLEPGDLADIIVLGADRNVDSFEAELDALRPMTAAASSVAILDKQILTAESDGPAEDPLGDVAAHEMVAPLARTIMARTREEQADLDDATSAAVGWSSWAYSATGEVNAASYPSVLTPHRVVRVLGAGGYLSGDYLISRVIHRVAEDGYSQQFTMRRNARSAGSGQSGLSLPGGIF